MYSKLIDKEEVHQMLSIGEFSKICEVTTKTLRYYEEIGLFFPAKINKESGYRYYEIEQLETMLLISRLKAYGFTLDELKEIINGENQTGKGFLISWKKRNNPCVNK